MKNNTCYTNGKVIDVFLDEKQKGLIRIMVSIIVRNSKTTIRYSKNHIVKFIVTKPAKNTFF